MPFLVRLLFTASAALLVAGSAMLFFSAGEDARSAREDLHTQLNAELDTLPSALAEVVVVGDFSTLRQTLERYVRRPQVTEVTFTDVSGTTLQSRDQPQRPRSPDWFRRLLKFEDISGQAEVIVGGRSYGRLALTLSAQNVTDRAWQRLLNHMAILTLAIGLDFLGIWFVLRTGLVPLQTLKCGAEALAAGATVLRLPMSGSPELRSLIGTFNRMAESLHSTQTQLVRRNEELTRFSEIAAHHLQEPSRRLIIFSQRLNKASLSGGVAEADAAASLALIQLEATRLRNLLRDIELYLAAGRPLGPIECQATAEVVEETLRSHAAAWEEAGAEVEVGPLPPVVLDRRRLQEIFAITLENAIRYRRPDCPLHIRISGAADLNRVHLRIEDNGLGIPPEYRERVFRVFERLYPKEDDTSTGIGLAILRGIAESTGGGAWIEESSDHGVAVVIELQSGDPR